MGCVLGQIDVHDIADQEAGKFAFSRDRLVFAGDVVGKRFFSRLICANAASRAVLIRSVSDDPDGFTAFSSSEVEAGAFAVCRHWSIMSASCDSVTKTLPPMRVQLNCPRSIAVRKVPMPIQVRRAASRSV